METNVVEHVKVKEWGGIECAWRGCSNHYQGEQPAGWINLLTWWSAWPAPNLTTAEVTSGPFCKRDAVLCPDHAAMLEQLLKDTGSSVKDVAGSA